MHDVNSYVSFFFINCICGVLVTVLTLSVVDHGFEPWSDQAKDYKIILVFAPSPLSM